MIQVVKPPKKEIVSIFKSVFLAGSIEMDTAEQWQNKAIRLFEDSKKSYTIYNPRRDKWDSSWEQSIKNKQFKEQVDWELEHLEKATWILFYFDPSTKSPITLLELGKFAIKNSVVVCPEGYFRKGNVDIFCERYNVTQKKTLEDAINYITNK